MIYNIIKALFWLIYTCIFPTKVSGTENIPREGAVILAANHLSNWDPVLVGVFAPRYLVYMAKQELFRVPILKNILHSVHSVPVRRGAADRSAIKAALNTLKDQGCICLFPEGTRSKDGRLHKGEHGVALLAAKSKAAVVPVAIEGTFNIRPFRRLHITYGKPIYFEAERADKEHLQEFTDKLMQKIAQMLKIEQKTL